MGLFQWSGSAIRIDIKSKVKKTFVSGATTIPQNERNSILQHVYLPFMLDLCFVRVKTHMQIDLLPDNPENFDNFA